MRIDQSAGARACFGDKLSNQLLGEASARTGVLRVRRVKPPGQLCHIQGQALKSEQCAMQFATYRPAPDMPAQSRGAHPRSQDRENLDGWLPQAMINAELTDNPVKRIKTVADAAAIDSEPTIKATLSWLVATKQLADARGITFRVFVIPPGSVAPDFVNYWKPWPRFFAWYLLCDVRHRRLVQDLASAGVQAVDLRPLLAGVPGTYRLSDGHWTEKGILMVAHRVSAELAPLMRH